VTRETTRDLRISLSMYRYLQLVRTIPDVCLENRAGSSFFILLNLASGEKRNTRSSLACTGIVYEYAAQSSSYSDDSVYMARGKGKSVLANLFVGGAISFIGPLFLSKLLANVTSDIVLYKSMDPLAESAVVRVQ
jgi:hypothetical protein